MEKKIRVISLLTNTSSLYLFISIIIIFFFMQLVSSLLSSDTHAKQTGEGVWSIRTTYFSFSLPAEDETRDGSLGNMGSLEDNIWLVPWMKEILWLAVERRDALQGVIWLAGRDFVGDWEDCSAVTTPFCRRQLSLAKEER